MFIVITATSIPDHLHGYLSRFLSEVDVGTYVGKVSPVVRDNLVGRCRAGAGEGRIVAISSDTAMEQGFSVQTFGEPTRMIMDMDGILLSSTVTGVLDDDGSQSEPPILDRENGSKGGLLQ